MIERPFPTHRTAALALLNRNADLPLKAAGFLGHVCVTQALSVKQRSWLVKLLSQRGLPPLTDGGAT